MSRRTKKQIEQLKDQIYNVLEADNPQSVRHVFYRMTDPRLPESVDKNQSGYRTVQQQLKKLRRSERVPYQWVSDESRRGWFTNAYESAEDFVRRITSTYRQNLWNQTSNYCEVWVESKSIAGVIQDVCEQMTVDLFPAGGYSSISFAHQAAEALNTFHSGDNIHILYVGDYDADGFLIDENLEGELRLHLNDNVDMNFKRIGINKDQIQRFDLPTKQSDKIKKGDRRFDYTVEAEGMPANLMRKLVKNEIEKLLPTRALEVAQVAEESEKNHLVKMANMLESGNYEF